MAISKTQLEQLYLAYFGRPADFDGLVYYTSNPNFDVLTVAAAFSASPESQALYGSTFGAAQINAIYQNLFNRDAEPGGLAFWLEKIATGAVTPANAAFVILNGALNDDAITVQNKMAVSAAFTAELNLTAEIVGYAGQEAAAVARAFLKTVDSTTDSLTAAMANLSAAVDSVVYPAARPFMLTSGGDTATANVFNSNPVLVPGTGFINSLSDIDTLTGKGENPTLNVVFGASNDISDSGTVQPKLIGIETINAEWTSADTYGLNLADAQGLKTVNINRITANNASITIQDMDDSVTNLSLSNSTRGGSVYFEHKEEVLTGTDEVLNVKLNNVRNNDLEFYEWGDGVADLGHYFETVNVAAAGTNDIDYMYIQANGREDTIAGRAADTTKQTLNITAGAAAGAAGSLEINQLDAYGVDHMTIVANHRVDIASDKAAALKDYGGLNTPDLETLTITGGANVRIDGLQGEVGSFGDTKGLTVNGSAMTGNLRVGVRSGTAGDDLFVLTSGSGNDEIKTFGQLGGDISTGLGNDIVNISSGSAAADMLGTASIDAGNGNNTVTARDLHVTASDANKVDNDGYDDVMAASIKTGSGNDTVTVRDLKSGMDWDNKDLEDSNSDDLYVIKGASVSTGAGADIITARTVAEGATIDAGAGDDVLNVSLNPSGDFGGNWQGHTVLAGDTEADQVTVKTTSNAGTREVTAGEVADRLGAVVDMGEGEDVANFTESSSLQNNEVTIVGRDAELRSAETVNVVALDRVIVTTTTSMADQDALTAGVQTDINANVIGTRTLNLTILNQVDDDTEDDTGVAENDNVDSNNWNARITADVMRFDSALQAINLDSQERTLLQNPATEIYEAGTRTNFVLENMRTDVALSLKANEATGVTAGKLADDSQLVINSTTGLVTTNSDAADVRLTVDYANARGLNDAAALNVAAASGAFDLDLRINATTTDTAATNAAGDNGNAASTTDDDAMMVENFTVNFADAHSHSVNANGFGDVAFRATRAPVVAGDVSSTAATSFTVNSAAGAGKTIAIDNVNADTIRVMNAAGTAVTAANVVLRVDASNNYNIVTGSGTDVIDMRADDVRSDDASTVLDRADYINAGTGRDTMIVSGSDSLGVNNNIEGGVASTIIDDDVFATLRGIEKILVDGDYTEVWAESMDITLDEQAKITGVDTIAVVGTQQQAVNVEIGNNFELATVAVDNANGQLTSAAAALVIDASQHTGQTLLSIESKDDDTDIQLINMDVRVNAKGGTVLNVVNSGDVKAQVEVRVYTADENDSHEISSFNAGNADGLVDINVTTGNIDKLVVLEGATANNNSGAEGGMAIAIDSAWTGAAFTVDASAVLDTDANTLTGGATIVAAYGDTAVLTISGTQNDDAITGGRGADTIDGNNGDDVIVGDEVTNQQELEVVTFAANYDAGDVITVTHNGNTRVVTIGSNGATGAQVAQAFATGGTVGGANGAVPSGAGFAASATATYDAGTMQLRLLGNAAGTDYQVTATTNNANDNRAQVQTLTIDSPLNSTWSATVVFNGVSYNISDTAFGAIQAASLNAAVIAAGGTLAITDNSFGTDDVLTITGPANGAAFPLITGVTASEAYTLTLAAGFMGTDQPNPTVVTETLARTVSGGADVINGGAGNDTIAGLTGADVLDGGDGVDTLDYTLSLAGVTVNLATNAASGGDAQGDVISNFENVRGSAYNDVLTGSDVANWLVGGFGNDVISGGAGNDMIEGGAGADTITGGTGNDTISLGAADGVEDIVMFASGDGVDTVKQFVAGTDTIQFTDFANRDLLPASLLQQTSAGGNAALSGNNTELLVVTGAAWNALLSDAENIANAIGTAFDLTTLADGRVLFSVQAGADSYVGYYTDVGNDDTIVAADVELIGKFEGAAVGAADFWMPTV